MANNLIAGWSGILGATRFSKQASSVGLTEARATFETTSIEDIARQGDLGRFEDEFTLRIFHSPALGAEARASQSSPVHIPYQLTRKTFATTGDPAVLGRTRVTNYPLEATQNELWQVNVTCQMNELLGVGVVLANYSHGGGLSATGAEAAVTLPAVAADEEVVLACSNADDPPARGTAPTLDWKIESAAVGDPGFTAPTDRHVGQTMTATPSHELVVITGPLTPLLWRIHFTNIGGTDGPTFFPQASIAVRKTT